MLRNNIVAFHPTRWTVVYPKDRGLLVKRFLEASAAYDYLKKLDNSCKGYVIAPYSMAGVKYA